MSTSESAAQTTRDPDERHDSDDELMVYETPKDYASWAQGERARLLAAGTAPDMVLLESEIRDHVGPRGVDEPGAEYAQRYCAVMNDMIQRGVRILNDQCTADVVASAFGTGDGREFDLGPGSGATKGEFRDFGKWFWWWCDKGKVGEVPERFKKFEKKAAGDVRTGQDAQVAQAAQAS